jgi:ABC-type transport system involved in cytochrome c biogenesis permease subunit
MQHRNIFAVVLLTIVTFGIYGIVWEVKTKIEMNNKGAEIPTAWLIIVPIVNIWWLYKYSEGVEKVTNGKMSAILCFVLIWVLGVIGMAIVQNEFNQVADTTA